MGDYIVRATAAGGQVRAFAATTKGLVEEAKERHNMSPIATVALGRVKIGRNVFINSNLLAMARGGITIEDNAMIAANVQLISNNHDPYDLCTPTATA